MKIAISVTSITIDVFNSIWEEVITKERNIKKYGNWEIKYEKGGKNET